MLAGRLGGVAGVRPNRHQTAAPRRQGLERLLPDDLARARAADEAFHAAVGEDDRAIAQMRRHRRAPRHDRRHGERLAFAPQRRNPLEEVDHRDPPAPRKPLEQPRGARFQRLEPAGELPLELDRDEPRRPHVAPPLVLEQAVQQRERLIVSPKRLFRQTFQISPLEALFGQRRPARTATAGAGTARA